MDERRNVLPRWSVEARGVEKMKLWMKLKSTASICVILLAASLLQMPASFAGCPGCCSQHGGVSSSCSSSGRIVCSDGTVSPSCSCASCGVTPVTPPKYNILNLSVTGSGTITSFPPGIDCGSDCSGSFVSGSIITLFAKAADEQRFVGWGGGACPDEDYPTCQFSIEFPQTILAMFAPIEAEADIVMYVETPEAGATYTGDSFIRGWAVSPHGIDRIELDIDGAYVMNVPIGESRAEVGVMYPDYPGSSLSGFNLAFFYSKLTAGGHTATVRAIDKDGHTKAQDVAFSVTRFNTTLTNNFIRDFSKIDLTDADVIHDGNQIVVEGMVVDDKRYNVTLGWNITLQGITIIDIQPAD